jgi:signal transduction histidine kinase
MKIILAASIFFTIISTPLHACQISLEGIHGFSCGDDLQWADPEFDDKNWMQIDVPASWQSQGLNPLPHIGWYRIRFFVSAEITHPAVVLGRIGNADEVFLNGTKIGGEGIIGEYFSEMEYKVRLYRIPKELLRPDAHNLLAVRVMNTYRTGGILGGPVCIGDYGNLLEEKIQREFARKSLEIAILVFLCISFSVCMMLHILGVRDIEYRYFGVFIFIYVLICSFDSLLFYETGLKTPFVQRIINSSLTILPLTALMFVLHFSKERNFLWVKCLAPIFAIIFVGLILPFQYPFHLKLIEIWSFLLLLTAMSGLFFSIKAYIRKLNESAPVLVGIAGLIIGGIIETIEMIRPRWFGTAAPVDYGMIVFLFSMMYALIARHSRIRKELRFLSGRILESHEQERKRLSRELHDGIGQSLLAIRLHLQMIHAKTFKPDVEKEILFSLISEISHTVEELRRMAMDLRPATLEKFSLIEVFGWYARKFTEKTGIVVNVRGCEMTNVALNVKDHLYRIYQEAFTNIVKHADATRVDVLVENTGKFLYIDIADNGHGFNLSEAMKHNSGLGLSTMKERTELLDGGFHIRSSEKGTTVHMQIPSA